MISKANQDSKEDNIWRVDKQLMLYMYYELNFFGDPSIQFKLIDSGSGNNQNSQSTSQSQPTQQSQPSSQSGSTTLQSTTGSSTTNK